MCVRTYYAIMESQLNGAQVFLLPLINSVFRSARGVPFFKINIYLFCFIFFSFTESTDPKPTSKAKKIHKWNWIILGIVIGLIALNILILVAGVL